MYRYVREAIDVLAVLAPTLNEAMVATRSKAYVVLDGTVLPIDRIAADRPSYSGKKRHHGMNVQVLIDPRGRLLWASNALSGATHDLTAAREHGIIDALVEADLKCWADKAYQGAAATCGPRSGSVGSSSGSGVTTPPTPRSAASESRPWRLSRAGAYFGSCAAAPTASPRS